MCHVYSPDVSLSLKKSRASRVDVKKLEKQEAKLRVSFSCAVELFRLTYALKAKIEKRARRDLYEGSKLLDQHRKQVSM